MKSKRFLYLSIGLLIYWLFSVTFFRNNLDTPIRLFSDEQDRLVYFERGSWQPERLIPFLDVPSEYPQIPTYLFGFIRALIPKDASEGVAYWQFSAIFSMLMLICLVSIIEIIYKSLPEKKYLAYLLLLPAPLYFTFNRFDILPALISLISFRMAQEKKWGLSAFLLAIGAMTKWYPSLLLPAFFIYAYHTEKRIQWQIPLVFVFTCVVLVIPTYLSGGLDALLTPYLFHNQRVFETVSLPTLLYGILGWQNADTSLFMRVFFLFQIIPAGLALFSRINTSKKLLYWCILIITSFVLFARIYSPQWLLWIFPFYIFAIKDKVDIGIAIIYCITNYIGFPVTWDYFGDTSIQLSIMGGVHALCLLVISWRIIHMYLQADRSPVTINRQ